MAHTYTAAVKVFGWLLLKRRLLTNDNLLKRGWSGDTECVLCGEQTETLDHLFLFCQTTRGLLQGLMVDKRSLTSSTSVGELWKTVFLKGGTLGRRECETLFSVWWAIWRERNCRIFENKRSTPGQICAIVQSCRVLWSSHCNFFFFFFFFF